MTIDPPAGPLKHHCGCCEHAADLRMRHHEATSSQLEQARVELEQNRANYKAVSDDDDETIAGLEAENQRLREALEEISAQEDCLGCEGCERSQWCLGCIARAALTPTDPGVLDYCACGVVTEPCHACQARKALTPTEPKEVEK